MAPFYFWKENRRWSLAIMSLQLAIRSLQSTARWAIFNKSVVRAMIIEEEVELRRLKRRLQVMEELEREDEWWFMNVLPSYENRLRMELYEQGYTDREIAWYMGVSTRAVCYWRESNKLKPNGRAGRKKKNEGSNVRLD